jgi:hypothetical protein
VDKIVHGEGKGDTTVRPSRTPAQLPVSKEELQELFYTVEDKVVFSDGPGDNTRRPPRPDFKPFWPEDLPLPKPRQQPPKPPAEPS